jgi:hypothetical protein
MSTMIRHSDTCQIMQVSSKRTIEAVVQDFEEHGKLNVILNKSVKINMKWNGSLYEGRGAGMDFTSSGPTISRTQTSARG